MTSSLIPVISTSFPKAQRQFPAFPKTVIKLITISRPMSGPNLYDGG